MFNTKQFRDKAAEYLERGKTANGANEVHDLASLKRASQRSLTTSNGYTTIKKNLAVTRC